MICHKIACNVRDSLSLKLPSFKKKKSPHVDSAFKIMALLSPWHWFMLTDLISPSSLTSDSLVLPPPPPTKAQQQPPFPKMNKMKTGQKCVCSHLCLRWLWIIPVRVTRETQSIFHSTSIKFRPQISPTNYKPRVSQYYTWKDNAYSFPLNTYKIFLQRKISKYGFISSFFFPLSNPSLTVHRAGGKSNLGFIGVMNCLASQIAFGNVT